MLSKAARKAAGICPVDRTWELPAGHAEVEMQCDLYKGHAMPRHRTVVDETLTVFWEATR